MKSLLRVVLTATLLFITIQYGNAEIPSTADLLTLARRGKNIGQNRYIVVKNRISHSDI